MAFFDSKVILLGALGASSGVAIYSTWRLVQEKRRAIRDNVYESQKLVNEYLVFHYGSPNEVLKYEFGPKDSLDFPKRCAELCLKNFGKEDRVPLRALDIGCAVGRSSFELTTKFEEVIGIDFSQAFVDVCNQLKRSGDISYFVQDEGDIVTHLTAKIPDHCNRSQSIFMQGDACNLPKDLGKFGCVLAANLICRLHKPYDFLNRLAGLVASNGILVITSPYTWLEQFTDKSTWLGGYQLDDGKVVRGFDTLKKVLGSDFDLIEEVEMPFFIRETAHKNQWSVAHATVWRRK